MTEIDAFNDAERLFTRIDTARGYKDYVPDEVMMGEPESDRFEKVLQQMESILLTMDPDDLVAWQEHKRENP